MLDSSSFANYSFNNRLSILQHKPDAIAVNSKTAWKKLGYKVVNTSDYIPILMPMYSLYFWDEDKEKWINSYYATSKQKTEIKAKKLKTKYIMTTMRQGKVYDISATDCSEEDYCKFLANKNLPSLEKGGYDILEQYFTEMLKREVKLDNNPQKLVTVLEDLAQILVNSLNLNDIDSEIVRESYKFLILSSMHAKNNTSFTCNPAFFHQEDLYKKYSKLSKLIDTMVNNTIESLLRY